MRKRRPSEAKSKPLTSKAQPLATATTQGLALSLGHRGLCIQVLKVGLVAVLVASSVAGCATKRYGRLTEVSGVESNFYTCREIQLEKAKVEAFRLQVAQGAQIDWRSVAGFLGDYGIGNAMEKSDAERSATTRMNSLWRWKLKKGASAALKARQQPSDR